jgi:hypothetical protein
MFVITAGHSGRRPRYWLFPRGDATAGGGFHRHGPSASPAMEVAGPGKRFGHLRTGAGLARWFG